FIVPPELVLIRPSRTSKTPVRGVVRHPRPPDSFVIAELPSTGPLRGRRRFALRAVPHGQLAARGCSPSLVVPSRRIAGALARLPLGSVDRELLRLPGPVRPCIVSSSSPASSAPSRIPPTPARPRQWRHFAGGHSGS